MLRRFVLTVGEFTLFAGATLGSMRGIWRRRGLFLRHCEFIGLMSINVNLVAAVFMGAVLGFQLYTAFHRFGAEALLGGSVGSGLFKELGPVMSAVMVTGRAGAAIAAEVASMRISEQIDALEVMAVDPIEFLVAPRVLAGFLMMPIIATFFSIVASIAAAGIACGVMGMDSAMFWHQFAKVVDGIEIVHCVVKGAVFGIVLTWVACFFGYRAHGGASSVGTATRTTVVATLLSILLSDYLLTSLLPYGYANLKAS